MLFSIYAEAQHLRTRIHYREISTIAEAAHAINFFNFRYTGNNREYGLGNFDGVFSALFDEDIVIFNTIIDQIVAALIKQTKELVSS